MKVLRHWEGDDGHLRLEVEDARGQVRVMVARPLMGVQARATSEGCEIRLVFREVAALEGIVSYLVSSVSLASGNRAELGRMLRDLRGTPDAATVRK